jgi:hypothetical protein
MRPADLDSVVPATRVSAGAHSADMVQSTRAALGVAVCAHCHKPEAAPELAGDRARGPDHLYLVCDRCGGRWQRQ